jgi:CBS domain-containing protein
MTEKLARRGLRIHQDYETDALTHVMVRETMEQAPILSGEMRLGELADRIASHDPAVSRHDGFVVVDDAGHLAGVLTRGDLLRALDNDSEGEQHLRDCATSRVVVTYQDELLSEAVFKMLANNIGRLPVVNRENPRQIVGYLGRSGILAGRLRRHEEEHVREQGWVARFQTR